MKKDTQASFLPGKRSYTFLVVAGTCFLLGSCASSATIQKHILCMGFYSTEQAVAEGRSPLTWMTVPQLHSYPSQHLSAELSRPG